MVAQMLRQSASRFASEATIPFGAPVDPEVSLISRASGVAAGFSRPKCLMRRAGSRSSRSIIITVNLPISAATNVATNSTEFGSCTATSSPAACRRAISRARSRSCARVVARPDSASINATASGPAAVSARNRSSIVNR